jgi:hypothetical protein
MKIETDNGEKTIIEIDTSLNVNQALVLTIWLVIILGIISLISLLYIFWKKKDKEKKKELRKE